MTMTTPAGDIQPTGRRVTADYIEVLHIRDGMTTSFNLMFDQLEMLE
jgi:ketosteroid isomerase-like protein